MDWGSLADTVPFLASATAVPNTSKISLQRVGEAVIVGMIAALGASQLTVVRLETKTDLRNEYSQQQFHQQVERRNKEIDQLRAQIVADAFRSQVQYEAVRVEIQRLAVAMEKRR